MNEPLISVIVPVYKVEKYLDECVGSIVDQTYRNLEIILVDDGSPDNCPQMCDDWAKKDERIYVIHKENGGAASARNAGLDVCKGEYIAFVDSDDWIGAEFIALLYDCVVSYSLDLAIGNVVRTDSIGKVLSKNVDYPRNAPELFHKVFSGTEFISLFLDDDNGISVLPCIKLYNASLFHELRFVEGRLYEDVFLSHHLLYRCERIKMIREAEYYYRQVDGRVMHAVYTPKRLDAFLAYEDRIKFYEENGFSHLNAKNVLRQYYCLRACKKNMVYKERKQTAYYKYRRLLRKNIRQYRDKFSFIQKLKFVTGI